MNYKIGGSGGNAATASEERGHAIFNGLIYGGVNYSGKCGVMTTKQFVQLQFDAGETLTDVFSDLDNEPAEEDLALKQALGGSFNTWYQTQKTANGGVDLTLTDISSSLDTNSPSATTLAVSNLADTNGGNNATVTLNGTFSPKNMSTSTTIYFEYSTNSSNIGTTSSEGLDTAFSVNSGIKITDPSNVESNTITVAANQTGTFTIKGFLTGLTESTTYFYRVVGLTTTGTGEAAVDTLIPGGIRSFTTTSEAKANQAIDFGSISDQTGTSYTAQATSKKSTDNSNTNLTITFISLDTAICTVGSSSISSGVSSVTVTKVASGLCQLTTSQAGDASFNAAAAVDQNFYFLAAQTITFEQPAGKTYGDAAFSVPATSFDTALTPAKSLLTITFTSTDTSVCTVGSSTISDGVSRTTVTIVKVGNCIISASQAGGTNSNSVKFSAANSVSRTIVISPATLTITAENKTKNSGDSEPVWSISKSGLKGSDTVTSATYNFSSPGYSSSTTPPTAAGSYTITPSVAVFGVGIASNYTITYVTGTYQITSNASQTITFAQPANQVYNSSTFTLEATASSTLTVSFTSSTTSICTVSGATLTKVSAGDCTIVASQSGGTVSTTTYGAATDVPRTFAITRAILNITSGFTAANKVFDGSETAAVTCSSVVFTGKIGSEDVSVSCTGMSGTFNNKNVANGKQVTGSGLTLTGTKSGNYQLTQPTTTANITKAPLTLTATDASKSVGAADPTFTSNLTGAISGEAVTVSSVSYSRTVGETVGTYTITPSGGTLSNSNYEITSFVTGTLTISAVSTYSITITASSSGTGTSSAATVSSGGSVNLTATASSGFTFTSWSCTVGSLTNASNSSTSLTGITNNTTCAMTFTAVSSGGSRGDAPTQSQNTGSKKIVVSRVANQLNAQVSNNQRPAFVGTNSTFTPGNSSNSTQSVANSAAATTANTGGIVAVVTNNTQSSSAASNSAVVSAANTTAQTEVSRNSNVPAAVAVNRDENTGKLSVTATNGWTGRISVAVVDTSSGEAVESFVEIVITPAPVATPQINFTPPANLFIPPAPNTPNRPTINTGLTINWQPSNTEVTGYVVTVNEKVACTSTTNSCSINQIIGPKSKVEVFAQGNDNTFSPPVLLPEFKPAAPIPGLLVFFPLSSSRLTRAEVKKLDEFVVAMKVAGLNQVELQGHTDIQGTAKGFDNKTLSKNRAEIVANYLRKNLKVVTRKDQFADTKPAVIGNGEPVFKNNRRTEVLVW